MNDLLKKLNMLVKTSLNDVLTEAGELRPGRLLSNRLGKDIDREVASLRSSVNEALSYEDELRARLQSLEAEIASWDEKADAAVSARDDVNARYAVDQLNRARQRAAMAEADLRDHQRVTQELILRVNNLEAAVADAHRAETESSPPAEAIQPGQMLSDVLRDMREKISHMGDLIAAKEEITPTPAPPVPPTDEKTVDDDLADRRQRLSKPK